MLIHSLKIYLCIHCVVVLMITMNIKYFIRLLADVFRVIQKYRLDLVLFVILKVSI